MQTNPISFFFPLFASMLSFGFPGVLFIFLRASSASSDVPADRQLLLLLYIASTAVGQRGEGRAGSTLTSFSLVFEREGKKSVLLF